MRAVGISTRERGNEETVNKRGGRGNRNRLDRLFGEVSAA